MADLMQKNAPKEEERGQHTDWPIHHYIPVLEFDRKITGCQAPGHEDKDQEPGRINPDWNAKNPSQSQRLPVQIVPPGNLIDKRNGSPIFIIDRSSAK